MMRKIIKYKLLATALATAFAIPAIAADPAQGPYVGISGGEADAEDACDDIGSIGFVGSCDETDTGWKIVAGYQLDRHWAVEAFYADLGESEAKGTLLGVPVSADIELDGWGASILAGWPINDKFSVYGKVGFFYYDIDISATAGGLSGSLDDGDETLMYGVGARYSFNDRLAVQVEWEVFDDIEFKDFDYSDVEFLSAGIILSY